MPTNANNNDPVQAPEEAASGLRAAWTVGEGSPRELIALETLERVAPILRNVAHPLRLRILDFLDRSGEARTVTDITAAAGGTGQALVSQQLRILKDQGVLTARREGNFIYYGIADRSVLLLLDCIRSHRQARTDGDTEPAKGKG